MCYFPHAAADETEVQKLKGFSEARGALKQHNWDSNVPNLRF